MNKITNETLMLIVIVVIFLAVSAFRMGSFAKKNGYNYYLFFFISLFLTAIPATLFFWYQYIRRGGLESMGMIELQTRMKRRRRDKENRDSSGQ